MFVEILHTHTHTHTPTPTHTHTHTHTHPLRPTRGPDSASDKAVTVVTGQTGQGI